MKALVRKSRWLIILGCTLILSTSIVAYAARQDRRHHPTPTPAPHTPTQQVIHGLIQNDGVVLAGSGFTVSFTGSGIETEYTITYNQPFTETPGVALTSVNNSGADGVVFINGIGPGYLIYRAKSFPAPTVSLLVIGQR